MSALAPDDPLDARDLERLTGDDGARAREAMDRLWAATRPVVARRLARLGVRDADAEDAAQRVAAAMWRQRRDVRARTVPQWRALVAQAVRRDVGKQFERAALRRRAEDGSVPPGDVPTLEAFVQAADEARRIYDAADRLWLGDAGEGGEVRAAAAQQVLVEGVSVPDAARMFDADDAQVEAWLRDPTVLGRAMFASLCLSGDALAARLLAEATMAPDGAAAPDGWARVFVLRARNGLTEAEIADALSPDLGAATVAAALELYRAALPFERIACSLLEALAAHGMEAEIARGGLWRRIAFEYAARHRLPHLQIVEREGPPAAVAGVRVDATTLNGWLSRGRLYAAVADRLGEEAR